MSKINIKKDYKNGNVLYGQDLNINNEVIELGVNDNFNLIGELNKNKVGYDNFNTRMLSKVDTDTFNTEISKINLNKADRTDLTNKVNREDVYSKEETYDMVYNGDSKKADKEYVDSQLSAKADKNSLNLKADKSDIGNLNNLNTSDKSSIVAAINSVNKETIPIATVDEVGLVKPDGITTTIDQDGTIHAVGGGGEQGSSDYVTLTNKPQINNVELNGNKSLIDLGLESSESLNNKLDLKANLDEVYSKVELDKKLSDSLENKTDKKYVDDKLSLKANVSDVYTKTDVDNAISTSNETLTSLIETKSNKDETYTKEETNSYVAEYFDTHVAASDDVYIGSAETAPEETKLVVEPETVLNNIGTEVVNSLEGNETNMAPSVNAVKWKLVGEVNGANMLNIPSDAVEIKLVTLFGKTDINNILTAEMLVSDLLDTQCFINQGYYDSSSNNGAVIWYGTKSSFGLAAASIGGIRYTSTATTKLYYR